MRIKNDSWLINRPIAHRGLWGGKIEENSMSAYENAIKNNYPIEIDLYKTTDGKILSFHDKTLKRMTGVDGYIYEKSYEEIKNLTLGKSNEHIPTFQEILELCKNKVPLLIELKNQPDKTYVEDVIEVLKNYKGEFAIQSFNPFYIKKVKELAPNFLRGILATNHAENEKKSTQFVIKNMPFNFMLNLDFISYDYRGLPLRNHKTKNKRIITWTVTSQEIFGKIKDYADNIIFENFIPKK